MATTLTANQVQRSGFCSNLNSTDLTGCEELKAAPGAGLTIFLDSITITTGSTAMDITIGSGESSSSVETTILGPFYMTTNDKLTLVFRTPIQLTANKSLTADSSAAGNVTILAEGFIS